MEKISSGRNYSRDEIELISKSAIGKTLKEIKNVSLYSFEDKENSNKGGFGQLIENYLFGIENNSDSSPDFLSAGIELKVTPYKINQNKTLSAKERLVLNIIDYMNEYKNTFETSNFWHKNKEIQILWYLWERDKSRDDLKVTHELLFSFPEEDLKIIKKDWEDIIEKIKNGQAHELSEADTMYLGACTKGENSSSLREQPFSNIKAMQRAFCLKTSYMTQLVRKYIGNYDNIESILKNTEESFDDYISNVVSKYKGKTTKELMSIFEINSDAKNINNMIICKMFNINSDLRNTDEFLKANIIPKTIRVEEDGRIKESMSFPAFKFKDIVMQSWNSSDLKVELESTKYMFFIFRNVNDSYTFEGIKLWNMPELILESDIRKMWCRTKAVLMSGNIVKEIDERGNRVTNFPGMKDSKYMHVRPHARDASDTFELPVPDRLTGASEYTKQCFWINSSYLERIIDGSDDLSNAEIDLSNNLTDYGIKENDSIFEIHEESGIYDSNSDISKIDYSRFNIFELYEYDISMTIISKLADLRISPYEIYLNGINSLEEVDISFNKKNNIVNAVNKMINSNDYNRSIMELNYQGISLSKCLQYKEHNLNIPFLLLSTDAQLLKYNIKSAMHKRIIEAINNNDIVIEESYNNNKASVILEKELKKYDDDNPISKYFLMKRMEKVNGYNIDNFADDFNVLYNLGKVGINNFGVYYKKNNIKEYIEKNYDNKIANILLNRLDGLTLEEIGVKNNITRERVRQICKNQFDKILLLDYYEDKYSEIFKKYDWTKDIFCELLNLKPYVYEYLSMKYDKGQENVNGILFDSEVDESIKNKYKTLKKVSVNSDGLIINNANDVLLEILKENQDRQLTSTELLELYNKRLSEYSELKLAQLDERTLSARIARMENTIMGFHQTIRYYDYSKISKENVEALENLLNLDDGFYSTDYLFENNKSFMKEINIFDCYELHNLLKYKIDDDENNVYFIRMPNFLVGYDEKDKFIVDKINEYAPISLEDFVDMLHDDYGHYKPTMFTYISQNMSAYLNGDILEATTYLIDSDIRHKLINNLHDNIYSTKFIKNLFVEFGIDISKNVFTRTNFDSLGYCFRNGYIIKKEYGSINKYLEIKSNQSNIIRIDSDLLKCGTIYNAINDYCKSYNIFKVNNGLYITKAKMNEKGINKLTINGIIKEMKEQFSDTIYFSVENIKKKINIQNIIDLGFDDEFIENIIFYNDDISTLRINNHKLFTFLKKKLSIQQFIEDEMEKYRSISISDFVNNINEEYSIDLTYDIVKGYLYGLSNIYYSSILDKLYIDKEDYYKEIYDE